MSRLVRDCNQMRTPARQERTVGNLPSEPRSPAAGQSSLARWAPALRRQAILFDKIAAPPDQSISALVATGVLLIANHARQVPRINITQTHLPPDLSSAQKVF